MLQKYLLLLLGLGAGLLSGNLSAASFTPLAAVALPSISSVRLANLNKAADERKWVTLDERQEPGSEVAIQLDPKASDSQRTVFNMAIPGFWMTSKKGPEGRIYQKIEIPGMGSHDQLGSLDLPLYRFKLALPFSKGYDEGLPTQSHAISLAYTALTAGELYYSVEDAQGNAVFDRIQVVK